MRSNSTYLVVEAVSVSIWYAPGRFGSMDEFDLSAGFQFGTEIAVEMQTR